MCILLFLDNMNIEYYLNITITVKEMEVRHIFNFFEYILCKINYLLHMK